ncbi:MAG: YhfC family intramembrane metalloprotease [Lachnospiraceae bacterium]|nr:YhfC family intramembrane metalloprotease [Lachnospiraceae bacterium]
MIDDAMLNLMMEITTLSFVIPVAFIAVWKLRMRDSLIPVFIGMGVYLVFAELFQSVPDTAFLASRHPLARILTQNIWLLTLYTTLTAVLLQGIGRFAAFRFFMKPEQSVNAAVSFGLGFGFTECVFSLAIPNLQRYSFGLMVNQKQADVLLQSVNDATASAYRDMIQELSVTSRMDLLLDGVWQCSFIFLQAALAVFFYYAVRRTDTKAERIRMILVSMGIQAFILYLDAFAKAGIVPRFVVVLAVIIVTVGVVQAAYRYYKTLSVKEETKETNQDGWNYAGKRYVSREKEKKDTDL